MKHLVVLGLIWFGGSEALWAGRHSFFVSEGFVHDEQGKALEGAEVYLKHLTMGAHSRALTDEKGRFRLVGSRSGGPYLLRVSMAGYTALRKENIYVPLSQVMKLELVLGAGNSARSTVQPSFQSEIVTLDEDQIAALPAAFHNLENFARTDPFFGFTNKDAGAYRVIAAGRHPIFNTIRIDGANHNEMPEFPGFRREFEGERMLIGLDSIQQSRMDVTSFDIVESDPLGGLFDMTTRTGSNHHQGSVFMFYEDEDTRADHPRGVDELPRGHTRAGFRSGGPIIRDRLFYFVNAEQQKRETSDFFGTDVFTEKAYLIRLDANLGHRHRLSLRYGRLQIDDEPNSFDPYPYRDTDTTILKWNRNGKNNHNEFHFSYRDLQLRVRPPSPVIIIEGSDPPASQPALPEQSSIELSDTFTFFRNQHAFTAGVYYNRFVWKDAIIDPNPLAATHPATRDFESSILAGFFGDRIDILPKLQLSLGLRVETQSFEDPANRPDLEAVFGYGTDGGGNQDLRWSPRIGFRLNPRFKPSDQLSGGVGLFSGRPLYGWHALATQGLGDNLRANLLEPNLANLIDEDKGLVSNVSDDQIALVHFDGIDQDTGKPLYRMNFTDPDLRFRIDPNRSRWQMVLGLRFLF